MKRIFIAVKIEPGEELKKIFTYLRSQLGKEKVKWVNPENIHVTLAFLGDTADEMITEACRIAENQCRDFGTFNFTLSGTGFFGNPRNPRVIWAGIKNSEKLLLLNSKIAGDLRKYGFRIEEKQFKPHVTLGRINFINDPVKLKSSVESFRQAFIQEVTVEEVILFESILKPEGPVYLPLKKFRLS